MAEKDPIAVPPTAALRQAARLRAVELAPLLVGSGEAGGLAAELEKRVKSLNFVPAKVRAWLANERGAAVGEIAVRRGELFSVRAEQRQSGDASLGRADPYFPLSRTERAMLGDDHARSLIEEAEYWRGKAERDPAIAERLAKLESKALPNLRRVATVVERVAEADAAVYELELQDAIEKAKTEVETSKAEESVAARPVLDANAAALGRRSQTLINYSGAASSQLVGLDANALTRLADATAGPWSKERFNRRVTFEQGSLQRDRTVAFSERLEALHRNGSGQHTGLAQSVGDKQLEKMRKIDAQLEEKRQEPGNPDGLFGEDAVTAALHDASQRRLAELAVEVNGPAATQESNVEAEAMDMSVN